VGVGDVGLLLCIANKGYDVEIWVRVCFLGKRFEFETWYVFVFEDWFL
jgi:hypothetical protein